MPARRDEITGPTGPVAIQWAYPGAERLTWNADREHWRRPLTPLELWFYAHCGQGVDRAWTELDFVPPNTFVRWQFAGPYLYYCDSPSAPDRIAAVEDGVERMVERFGSPNGFWKDYCEPRIDAVCKQLAAATTEPFAALAVEWGYGWHQTFTSCTVVDFYLDKLVDLLVEAMGPDGALVAQELAHAGDNASQDVDDQIWSLAHLLRAQSAGSAAFRAAFDELVNKMPDRSTSWSLDDPTWAERPDLVFALVQAMAGTDASPQDRVRAKELRRQAAMTAALDALDAAHHERFRALVALLDEYVGVREGRALWQMTLMGCTRRLALRVGADLVQQGRVDQPDDVLFLEPAEWEQATGSLRETVARRRAELTAWSAIDPPMQIGVLDDVVEPVAEDDVLKGHPVSRGVATGPACIVYGPDDWDRMAPGDVLVCPLTSPAWTPLFALAAAVVTESGNMFSHPAITAREYGIPAVLGLHDACVRIRDGEVVTVDGTAGTVHRTSTP